MFLNSSLKQLTSSLKPFFGSPLTELGNFFQVIRSDPAFILPDKLVPMPMFIEKNAFENVGFHVFHLPGKTKRMKPELHPEKL